MNVAMQENRYTILHTWHLTPLHLSFMYPAGNHKCCKCDLLNASYLHVCFCFYFISIITVLSVTVFTADFLLIKQSMMNRQGLPYNIFLGYNKVHYIVLWEIKCKNPHLFKKMMTQFLAGLFQVKWIKCIDTKHRLSFNKNDKNEGIACLVILISKSDYTYINEFQGIINKFLWKDKTSHIKNTTLLQQKVIKRGLSYPSIHNDYRASGLAAMLLWCNQEDRQVWAFEQQQVFVPLKEWVLRDPDLRSKMVRNCNTVCNAIKKNWVKF